MLIAAVIWCAVNTLLLVAVVAYVSAKKNPCDHAADLAAMHSQLRQFDADLDDLFDRLKSMASRKGMRAKRDESALPPTAQQPGETAEQWKARMRRAKQNGELPMEA